MKPTLPLRRSASRLSEYREISRSPKKYSPLLGLSMRPTMFSSVDLPQPEGPMTATNSPLVSPKSTLSSAVVSSSVVRYFLLICDSLIIAGSPSGTAVELNAVEPLEAFVARRDDALALAEAVEHLDPLGIAPAEANVAPHGVIARLVDDEHPLPARIVVERAVSEHERIGRLADLE